MQEKGDEGGRGSRADARMLMTPACLLDTMATLVDVGGWVLDGFPVLVLVLGLPGSGWRASGITGSASTLYQGGLCVVGWLSSCQCCLGCWPD